MVNPGVVSDKAATANKDYVYADVAMHEVLLELARNYKGKDPALDARIDAAAGMIANDQRVKFIAPHTKNAPKVPLYLEGEPGQGKSSLVVAACKKFCEICGLNFIYEPADDYVFQPTDFYYVKVNLSGAQNKSDFGGMLIRTEAEAQSLVKSRQKAAASGVTLLGDTLSRMKGIVGHLKNSGALVALETKQFEQGSLDCVEVKLSGDPDQVKSVMETVLEQIMDDSKTRGVGLTRVEAGANALEDKLSYEVTMKKDGSTTLSVYAPRILDAKTEFASAVLPSIRFAKFKNAKFGLVNFDDVANASENIRNILLEVLQEGRYTGTMDIGNAYVTLSGNQGAEDGTNTMSRMSDAELTRMRKINVIDHHEDWSKRVLKKFADSPVGDCYVAGFIHRMGSQEGIFREPTGQRGKRGVRKTNGRALENALEVITQHFAAAQHANMSPLQFRAKIKRDFKDCAGERVAEAFDTYLYSMVTEAIPLADSLINDGKFHKAKFDEHSHGLLDTSGKDFCFRFGAALADAVVNKATVGPIATEPDSQKVFLELQKAMTRACFGLAELSRAKQDTIVTYTLALISQKLMNKSRFTVESESNAAGPAALSAETAKCLGTAIMKAGQEDAWGDQSIPANKDVKNSMEANCAMVLGGSNQAGDKSRKPVKAAA